MRRALPSQTALATAYMRAIHVHLDGRPPVLDDRVALRLLPGYVQRYIRRQSAFTSGWANRYGLREPMSAAMRSQIVVRARYAEDCLLEARQQGTSRYVILGAGLDTFALRQPAPAIQVLEIDHPATQGWKRSLLKRRGLEEPAWLSYLAVDFERQSLNDLWIENDSADFVSWLGTTYYLSRDGIRSTLEIIARRTLPGTQLVLDYWDRRPRLFDTLLTGTRIAVALQGEPMRSFFEPDEIEALVTSSGWQVMENIGSADQNARYLSGRKDRLAVPSFAHLLRLQR